MFAQDRASLLYLANLGCIDQNPWMSRLGSLDNPDFILIDLDPQDCPYDMIVEAALMVKQVLDEIGLEGYPKTTGGGGMHVYIPVETDYTYEADAHFRGGDCSHLTMRARPELFTTPRSVAKREHNRVYFDWVQNAKSKTIAAPYVLRAYTGAPVATPLEWTEVRKDWTRASSISRTRAIASKKKATYSPACCSARKKWKKPSANWKNSTGSSAPKFCCFAPRDDSIVGQVGNQVGLRPIGNRPAGSAYRSQGSPGPFVVCR